MPVMEALTEGKPDYTPVRQSLIRQQRPEALEPDSKVNSETCSLAYMAEADVDTVEQFQKFDFQVSY